MWVHRLACLPYSISFHWSTPLRPPPQCRCQTHSPLKQTKVEPGYEEDQVTLAQMSDPPRLTRPARTPSTVRAPPLSPWVICWNLLKYSLFPHLTAAFLVAACTKHALTVGESGFLHICLAINWSRDRNLDWECWICYFTEISKKSKCIFKGMEKTNLNFFETIRGEVRFCQAPTCEGSK